MIKIIKQLILRYNRYKYGGVYYARKLGVSVGDGCRIYTKYFGSEPWLIEIGNRVTITSNVRILTHDGATWLMRDESGRRYKYDRVRIGDDVFIGINSIIMPGVIIENNVIVAAGSVVTKSIPSGYIVGGNPAKIIGDYYKYKENALKNLVSDRDLDMSKNYRERILDHVGINSKKYITNE